MCTDYCDYKNQSINLLPGEYYDKGCMRTYCNSDFSLYIQG